MSSFVTSPQWSKKSSTASSGLSYCSKYGLKMKSWRFYPMSRFDVIIMRRFTHESCSSAKNSKNSSYCCSMSWPALSRHIKKRWCLLVLSLCFFLINFWSFLLLKKFTMNSVIVSCENISLSIYRFFFFVRSSWPVMARIINLSMGKFLQIPLSWMKIIPPVKSLRSAT